MLEPPLRLVCLQYRTRLKGGVSRPPLVVASDGTRKIEIVLKVRHPDCRENHFEQTSLACELICAALARAVGLPVPDYAVVEVPEELPASIADPAVRELLTRNRGENFGLVYREGFMLWDPDHRSPSPDLLDGLEDVLAFDATVINGDRKRPKPNLLLRGDSLLLIDHSLTLPVFLWNATLQQESPLFPEEEVRQHCTYPVLIRRQREFRRMLERWRSCVDSMELARLRSYVPTGWERRPGELDQIFSFLYRRPLRFENISAALRSVMS